MTLVFTNFATTERVLGFYNAEPLSHIDELDLCTPTTVTSNQRSISSRLPRLVNLSAFLSRFTAAYFCVLL